jgi:hypothetical protein
LENRRVLAVTVNTFADFIDGSILDGSVTLRDAIDRAPANETIDFDVALNGATITLDRELGELAFAKSLTIDASLLPNGITIDGDDQSSNLGDGIRIFNITAFGDTTPLVTLIGLKLTGADAFGGSAIQSTAMLRIEDCEFVDNSLRAIWVNVAGTGQRDVLTVLNSVIDNNGAGISVISGTSSAPTSDSIEIINSTITGNDFGTNGGGIYANLYGASLMVQDSTISLNGGGPLGGGIGAKLQGGAQLTITNCDLSENIAGKGGGLYAFLSAATLDINGGTSFADNSAVGGGGIALETDWPGGNSSIEIADSAITGNKLIGSGIGGGGLYGMFDAGVSLSITRTTISNNRAYYGSGGGIRLSMPYAYGGSGSQYGTSVELDKVVITGNTAANFGGGFCAGVSSGSVSIIDSVIRDNEATLSGGGLCFFLHGSTEGPTTLTIGGSEISENTAGEDGGGLAVFAKASGAEMGVYNSTISGNDATAVGALKSRQILMT